MVRGPLEEGIVGRAIGRGLLDVRVHDLREHTSDRHRVVDDMPFGGGPGMVMLGEGSVVYSIALPLEATDMSVSELRERDRQLQLISENFPEGALYQYIVTADGQRYSARVCGIRKSDKAAEHARKRAMKSAAKKSRQVQPETLEMAEYIMVLTTLQVEMAPARVLELYRSRWQVELAFKRIKTLLGAGHVPKAAPGLLEVAFQQEGQLAVGQPTGPHADGRSSRSAWPTPTPSRSRSWRREYARPGCAARVARSWNSLGRRWIALPSSRSSCATRSAVSTSA